MFLKLESGDHERRLVLKELAAEATLEHSVCLNHHLFRRVILFYRSRAKAQKAAQYVEMDLVEQVQ
jgi:hypothetical protein